jgi:hypothetical protein
MDAGLPISADIIVAGSRFRVKGSKVLKGFKMAISATLYSIVWMGL